MKTDAMIRRCLTTISLASALALLAPSVRAQDAPPPAPKNPGPVPTGTVTGPKIDIQISGGVLRAGPKLPATIKNIVDFLNEKEPGVNIVYSPAAGDVVINDLTLKSVDVESFCKAIPFVTDGAVSWQHANGTWGLVTGRPPGARQVEAFNLSGYLERFGGSDEKSVMAALDEVIQIIHETAAMLQLEGTKSAGEFSVRFHRGANLLVVVGSPEAIGVARTVVFALQEQRAAPRTPGAPAASTYDKLTPVR